MHFTVNIPGHADAKRPSSVNLEHAARSPLVTWLHMPTFSLQKVFPHFLQVSCGLRSRQFKGRDAREVVAANDKLSPR